VLWQERRPGESFDCDGAFLGQRPGSFIGDHAIRFWALAKFSRM